MSNHVSKILVSFCQEFLADLDVSDQFFLLLKIFVKKVEQIRRIKGHGKTLLQIRMKSIINDDEFIARELALARLCAKATFHPPLDYVYWLG